jgi:DNA primase
MTVFEQVKSALNMPTVARSYGLNINRSGMAICPFHDEKTPSAKIYPDSFHCFGCGEYGDVIGFTEKMFGLSPIDAVKKLNDDFGLNIEIGHAPTRSEKSEFQKRADERKAYEDWEKFAWKTLHDYLWLMRDWREKYAPIMPNIPIDRRFVYFGKQGRETRHEK